MFSDAVAWATMFFAMFAMLSSFAFLMPAGFTSLLSAVAFGFDASTVRSAESY